MKPKDIILTKTLMRGAAAQWHTSNRIKLDEILFFMKHYNLVMVKSMECTWDDTWQPQLNSNDKQDDKYSRIWLV
jgi:hypothetical protein